MFLFRFLDAESFFLSSVHIFKIPNHEEKNQTVLGDEGILKFIAAKMAGTLLTVQLIPAKLAAFATVAVEALPYDVVDEPIRHKF